MSWGRLGRIILWMTAVFLMRLDAHLYWGVFAWQSIFLSFPACFVLMNMPFPLRKDDIQ